MKVNNLFSIIISIIIIISLQSSTFQQETPSDRKLIFVYEHVRHGARGPSSSYSSIFNDGWDEYRIHWDGDGELSPIGKKQHYYLGVRNRLKYKDLINFKKFDPREILIHATNYNRTHQSINSELLAMFPPGSESALNEEEKAYWKIINKENMQDKDLADNIKESINELGNQVNKGSVPIFNIHPFPNKRIFLVDNCVKINAYRDEKCGKEVGDLYKYFNETYGEVLQKFFNFTSRANFFNYDKMKSITDHFVCDYDNQKDLSFFQSETGINLEKFYQDCKEFYGKFIFDWFVDEYTSGLEETHLMQDMLGYMERRIKNKDITTYKAPKMVMDVGHDTTVGPIARFIDSAFNCGYHKFCEFACNVYFELYDNLNNTYSVDYFMDDERLFSIGFDEFKEKLTAKFWEDEKAEEFCGNEIEIIEHKTNQNKNSFLYLVISIISSSLFIIFSISFIVVFRRLKKLQKKMEDQPLFNVSMAGDELPDLN